MNTKITLASYPRHAGNVRTFPAVFGYDVTVEYKPYGEMTDLVYNKYTANLVDYNDRPF